MESQDTQVLLHEASRGDRKAFAVLVQNQRDPLEKYVRLRLGTHLRERVEVDDVIQETYSRALQSISGFCWHGEGSFLHWLQGISEHVILELAKKRRRDEVLYLEGDPVAKDASPSKNLRRVERFQRLQEALESLESDYREAVLLSRIHGLPIREIAGRMNRSPKSVAHLLARALKQLKEVFGDTESLHLPSRRIDGNTGAGDDE